MSDNNGQNTTINWFPGHMRKAINAIQERIKTCDGVIEIGDSRAPFSSFPNYLDKITEGKYKVFVFSKSDMADPNVLKMQMDRMQNASIKPFCLDLRDKKAGKDILAYLSTIKTKEDQKFERLGFPLPTKRFLVLGIPNVGKSTFINCLAGKRKALVENKPGKTRAQQLIHVTDKILIYDAPGVLEPNYEDKTVSAKLALLGSIKQDLLPIIYLSDYLLDILLSRYKENLIKRYSIDIKGSKEDIFLEIAKSRKLILPGEVYDIDRARNLLIYEFRNGSLGRISLDE